MMLSENYEESKYGLTLFLLSNSNLFDFPRNNPALFKNIFSNGVNLDHTKSYELALGSIHIPSYVNTLDKLDFDESFIEYRIGKFDYNDASSQYELDESSSRRLFKLAPDRDFVGLYSKGDENSQHNLHSELTEKKKKFIEELSNSLTLEKNVDENQKTSYNLYREYLYSNELNTSAVKDNLMCHYFKDYDILFFKNLNHHSHLDRGYMFHQLMKSAGYESEKYNEYLKQVLPSLNSFPTTDIHGVALDIPNITNFESLMDYLLEIVDENFLNIGILPDLTETQIKKIVSSKTLVTKQKSNEMGQEKKLKDLDLKSIMGVYITFGSKMRKFLNLKESDIIITGICGFPKKLPIQYLYPIHLNYYKVKISTIMIYTDLVGTAIRVGNSITNLLEVISFSSTTGNVLNRNNKTFRPLKHNNFKKASVEIRDPEGKLVKFPEGSFSAIEIYIKPRDSSTI